MRLGRLCMQLPRSNAHGRGDKSRNQTTNSLGEGSLEISSALGGELRQLSAIDSVPRVS